MSMASIRNLVQKEVGSALDNNFVTIEISKMETIGNRVVVTGTWNSFLQGGKYRIEIQKGSNEILSFQVYQ